jgi:hypothetical protein
MQVPWMLDQEDRGVKQGGEDQPGREVGLFAFGGSFLAKPQALKLEKSPDGHRFFAFALP